MDTLFVAKRQKKVENRLKKRGMPCSKRANHIEIMGIPRKVPFLMVASLSLTFVKHTNTSAKTRRPHLPAYTMGTIAPSSVTINFSTLMAE
jgi:hypothetical protein